MKTRFSALAVFGLATIALPMFTGCKQDGGDQASLLITSANAEPSVAETNSNALAAVVAPATNLAAADLPESAVTEIVAVPVPAPAPEAEKQLPANLKPTAPAGEVIKLAQAGVDESVMLAFVTNSTGMFSLSSDDIIYLSDLGVSGNVVTAMLEHDQGVKSAWTNQAAPQPAVAAAPTYVNPPQPELQPAPAVVNAAPVAEPAPAANVTYNYFYDSLSPYGTWVDVDGYGRCWQPTVVVVDPGWRPYSDRGHWVYTDSGWYWASDYSWGWAPFHYGRWFSHPRYGWCWWPDRVWGSSWVSWRYSNDYCGWAPLPPAAYYRAGVGFSYYGSSVGFGFNFGLGADFFTFVSWNNFCDPRPWHHRLPRERVRQVFNHTTIVNNYVTGSRNTVINRGIPVDRVRERTRDPVRVVAIRDHNSAEGRSGRNEQFSSDGRSLVVRRPHIPESAAPRTPSLRDATALKTEGTRERSRQFSAPATPTLTPRPTTAAPLSPALDNSRSRGLERNPESRRESPRIPTGPPVTTVTPSPAPRTVTPSAPPTVRSAPAIPTVREDRGSPRQQEERREAPVRERRRDSSQAPTTSPTIVGAPSTPPVTTPSGQINSRNQLIVIGRPNNTTATAPAARAESRVANSQNTYNWSPAASSKAARQPVINPTPQPSTAPSYRVTPEAPQRAQGRFTPPSQPSFTPPPVQRSYTPPAAPRTYTPPPRTYTAPRQTAPTYSAPAPMQRSQPSPAPSYTPPSRSFSSPSQSAPSRPERSSSRGRQPQ